jgi:hypothetical protein
MLSTFCAFIFNETINNENNKKNFNENVSGKIEKFMPELHLAFLF